MKLNWKWSLYRESHSHMLVKLAISVLLVGVAVRLVFVQTSGFSSVPETPFAEQTVKAQPAVSVDSSGNRDNLPENRTHVSDSSPIGPVSDDLQEDNGQIPGNSTESPENGTQFSMDPEIPVTTDLPEKRDQIDLQEDREHIPGNSKSGENGTQVSVNPEPLVTTYSQEERDLVSVKPKQSIPSNSTDYSNQTLKEEKCDIFTGDWIPTSSGPAYTNDTCSYIEGHQNCMMNGRPDTGYLFWRWNPRNCELPPFNAELFLDFVRNKTWALIGDSITRNHVQSLLCLLSKVEKATEVYHDEGYRSRRWHFPSYNFTISTLWSPFLAKAAIFEDYNGVSTADVELHLDKLDPTWTDLYRGLDYMMFSSGEWFVKTAIYYENNTILGCHNCANKNQTEFGFDFAYRKVLQNVFNFIIASNHKGVIFYRTSTPDHFENGEWYNGGNCQRTAPVKEGEFKMNELNRILRVIELEEFEKAAARASEKGMNLKLLDVMQLSLLRPDGHPGLYRYFHPLSMDNSTKIYYDCLHWCLPGPIDSWNDLLMEMVVNG